MSGNKTSWGLTGKFSSPKREKSSSVMTGTLTSGWSAAACTSARTMAHEIFSGTFWRFWTFDAALLGISSKPKKIPQGVFSSTSCSRCLFNLSSCSSEIISINSMLKVFALLPKKIGASKNFSRLRVVSLCGKKFYMPACAATSAAKSVSFFSMPSPSW